MATIKGKGVVFGITATGFSGDGSGLTDINAPASGWTNIISRMFRNDKEYYSVLDG